jgi:hypothetical protein
VIFLVILLGVATVNAGFIGDIRPPAKEIKGLDYPLIGNISIDPVDSYTVIDAIVENTGFETVYVSLPSGWEDDDFDQAAKGEPIIVDKVEIHKKYGFPEDRFSFIHNYYVFQQRAGFAQSKGLCIMIQTPDRDSVCGWRISPNERLIFHVRLHPKDTDVLDVIIDPFSLEQNRSDIKVIEWNQRMIVFPDQDTTIGFLRAPWIVKGGTITEAFPGVFANLSAFEGDYYHRLLKLETPEPALTPEEEVEDLNPPAWDQWFSSSSGVFNLRDTSLASLKTEHLPIPEIEKTVTEEAPLEDGEEMFIPVWYVDFDTQFIRYDYRWKRGEAITGIDVDLYSSRPSTLTELYGDTSSTTKSTQSTPTSPQSLDLTTVPEWFGWFN